MIVALGVVVIALILLCIVFFIQYKKMKAHLLKVNQPVSERKYVTRNIEKISFSDCSTAQVEEAGHAERLFPSHGEGH